MSALREAAQAALEALKSLFSMEHDETRPERLGRAIAALRAALAEQEKAEPVAWMHKYKRIGGGGRGEQSSIDEFPPLAPDGYEHYESEPLYTEDAIHAAVEAEREACARLCAGIEDRARSENGLWPEKAAYLDGRANAAEECADAIRARGKR